VRFFVRRGRKRKRPKPTSKAWLEQIEEKKVRTYVFRNGKLVDKRRAKPLHYTNDAPGVISDIMEPTQHMATGKFHTSKHKFREDTKRSGCVEIGNETGHLLKPRTPVQMDRRQRRDDIRRAIYDLKNSINR
jgi:hypothetical protein